MMMSKRAQLLQLLQRQATVQLKESRASARTAIEQESQREVAMRQRRRLLDHAERDSRELTVDGDAMDLGRIQYAAMYRDCCSNELRAAEEALQAARSVADIARTEVAGHKRRLLKLGELTATETGRLAVVAQIQAATEIDELWTARRERGMETL